MAAIFILASSRNNGETLKETTGASAAKAGGISWRRWRAWRNIAQLAALAWRQLINGKLKKKKAGVLRKLSIMKSNGENTMYKWPSYGLNHQWRISSAYAMKAIGKLW
jgi:hypothetical protein